MSEALEHHASLVSFWCHCTRFALELLWNCSIIGQCHCVNWMDYFQLQLTLACLFLIRLEISLMGLTKTQIGSLWWLWTCLSSVHNLNPFRMTATEMESVGGCWLSSFQFPVKLIDISFHYSLVLSSLNPFSFPFSKKKICNRINTVSEWRSFPHFGFVFYQIDENLFQNLLFSTWVIFSNLEKCNRMDLVSKWR